MRHHRLRKDYSSGNKDFNVSEANVPLIGFSQILMLLFVCIFFYFKMHCQLKYFRQVILSEYYINGLEGLTVPPNE